jgi:hypothetical protein
MIKDKTAPKRSHKEASGKKSDSSSAAPFKKREKKAYDKDAAKKDKFNKGKSSQSKHSCPT